MSCPMCNKYIHMGLVDTNIVSCDCNRNNCEEYYCIDCINIHDPKEN